MAHRNEEKFPMNFGPATTAKGRAFLVLERSRPQEPDVSNWSRGKRLRQEKARAKAALAKKQRQINRRGIRVFRATV